jgi:hypothetical protein
MSLVHLHLSRFGTLLFLGHALVVSAATNAVTEATQKSRLPCDPQIAKTLVARKTPVAPTIDGKLEESVWSHATVSQSHFG